jgi:tetrahydromethanopterin S-methyltransferase subunit A
MVDAPLDRDGAIQQIHRELDQMRQVKKCTSGEYLLDVRTGVPSDLAAVDTPAAQAARTELRRWWEAGNQKRHRRPGCEVCLPIAPYNQFSAILGGTEPASPQAPTSACGCSSGGVPPAMAAHQRQRVSPRSAGPLLPGDRNSPPQATGL